MLKSQQRTFLFITLLFAVAVMAASAHAETRATPDALARLVAAYPEALERIDGNTLHWRNGKTMPLDDGQGPKPFAAWLAKPDIEDTLSLDYPAGAGPLEPARDRDPGRARNSAFFDEMYGNCRKGEVTPHLETIVWLSSKAGQRLQVTAVNGVAARLNAISRELDALPQRFDKFLVPSAGTYNCRVIAGTDRVSAHGYGIAIDLAVKESDYWRWGAQADATIAYKNRIPLEIVHIFERHGFIWGGRWYHYDTMHFEYRPELLPPLAPLDGPPGANAGHVPEK